jgi:hypothetical protein
MPQGELAGRRRRKAPPRGALATWRHGGSYFNQRAFPDNFRMADNRIQLLMGDWEMS